MCAFDVIPARFWSSLDLRHICSNATDIPNLWICVSSAVDNVGVVLSHDQHITLTSTFDGILHRISFVYGSDSTYIVKRSRSIPLLGFTIELCTNFYSDTFLEQRQTFSSQRLRYQGEQSFRTIAIFLQQQLRILQKKGVKRYKRACEASLACSTCHVIVKDVEYYNKLEEPADEENDMLDLAFGLTETSRLGCQVIAKPELDGMRLAIPSATRNFAVDGYVPKPH
ncbi:hypothetical protein TIFTF001_002367 [Ficus carica]|uniref:2Fe-2S ferredoxin-type domain-containing protein n=1 Tax=Ficus carica TaxID=3494 RepID=A0AA87Z3J9_FICCA|nr:hypothetical protein TIFTF001_002367 [Ficus carica]